jgi:hypothetical protein
MDKEKLRILEMIKDGTVSPQEGLDLINALAASGTPATPASTQTSPPVSFDPCCHPEEEVMSDESQGCCKPRWLYINVDDQESGKKVNIRVPITLAKFAGKFIPKEARAEMREKGIDLDLTGILDQLTKEGQQDLVEVMEGDKKIVRIYTK